MFRAGSLTNAAGITQIMSKYKLIETLFAESQHGQRLCWTIDRTEAAPRTFLFVKDWKAASLGPDSL